jgi:flavin reductase (DIM6/NTAB) family NADH-FMN oxidoreductase RutF
VKIIEAEELRQAMRQWTTGVSIVSAASRGVRHGMTVSSFTSVALDPPTIIISLERISRTQSLIKDAGTFGITFLNSSQQMISERFAGGESEDSDRFDGLDTWTLVTGSPLLTGGLAFLDCRLISMQWIGSNTLVIGEVIAARIGDGGSPLLYYNRQYRKLQD